MIEGINTAAENVFIYDRKISTTKLDQFTFDNIKGRAGRMFQHNIGEVFLYNHPPDQAEFNVRVPLFAADELMAPELLLQLKDDTLTLVAQRRKRNIENASILPAAVLSRWAEFGIDKLNRLAERVKHEISTPQSLLAWKGMPSFDQVEATFGAVWDLLDFQKHDIRSPRQLATFANRLRMSQTIRAYLDGFVRSTGLDARRRSTSVSTLCVEPNTRFPRYLERLTM